jgi:sphingosine-1-phosphate phosphatase 1
MFVVGLCFLRAAIGFSCIVATRAICKSASYATLCFLLQLNSSELKKTAHTAPSSAKNTVEISYKYITYVLLGFNTLYLLPNVFKLLRIERPTFYTEI